jgi:hypothetical protein
MMFIQKMFRVTPLFCAAVAAAAAAQAQDQRPRGLVGSVSGGVYTSPTGAFSIEVPVLASLGGAVSDTPKVVIFQDNFGLQVSVGAFVQDATQKWELSTRGTKDYLIYFLSTYVLPDFRSYCPKTTVESAVFSPELMEGTVFAYLLMPGGSMFEVQDVFGHRGAPPVAKRGNMIFVKNGFTFVISTELSERVTEGSSYNKTPQEENKILHARLLGIVRKMQFPAPAARSE